MEFNIAWKLITQLFRGYHLHARSGLQSRSNSFAEVTKRTSRRLSNAHCVFSARRNHIKIHVNQIIPANLSLFCTFPNKESVQRFWFVSVLRNAFLKQPRRFIHSRLYPDNDYIITTIFGRVCLCLRNTKRKKASNYRDAPGGLYGSAAKVTWCVLNGDDRSLIWNRTGRILGFLFRFTPDPKWTNFYSVRISFFGA